MCRLHEQHCRLRWCDQDFRFMRFPNCMKLPLEQRLVYGVWAARPPIFLIRRPSGGHMNREERATGTIRPCAADPAHLLGGKMATSFRQSTPLTGRAYGLRRKRDRRIRPRAADPAYSLRGKMAASFRQSTPLTGRAYGLRRKRDRRIRPCAANSA